MDLLTSADSADLRRRPVGRWRRFNHGEQLGGIGHEHQLLHLAERPPSGAAPSGLIKSKPPVPIGFRKDFTLSAPNARRAHYRVPAGIEGYSVCVNGKEALAQRPARVQGYRTVDIATCLR